MNQKTVGKNIKKIRADLELTQPQTAEKAGISTNHLSHVETGNTVMSIDCLLNLCAALNTTPNDILMGEFDLTAKATSAMLQKMTEGLSPDENRLLLEIADSMRKLKINRE